MKHSGPSIASPEKARTILRRLRQAYPQARLALHFSNPLVLLIALILAAQCTDERVNQVTQKLFQKYPTAQDYLSVPQEELAKEIHPTGFFRQKAQTIQACCKVLQEKFDGKVPDRLEDLLTLPGVGRKTANILIGNAFGRPAIGVDTHVGRLAQRLGLTQSIHPDKIEADLAQAMPQKDWVSLCHLLQAHGRKVCLARRPLCGECTLRDLCPYPHKVERPK